MNPPGPAAGPGRPAPAGAADVPGAVDPGPPRRRRGLVMALTAVGTLLALALVGTAAALAVRAAQPHRHVGTPATLAGSPRISDPALLTLVQQARAQVEQQGGKHAVAAFYGEGTLPSFFLVGSDKRAFRDENKEVDDLLKGLTTGAGNEGVTVPAPTPFPSGKLGGRTRCGPIPFPGTTASYCAWSDASTTGVLVSFSQPPPGAATLTDTVRQQAEK